MLSTGDLRATGRRLVGAAGFIFVPISVLFRVTDSLEREVLPQAGLCPLHKESEGIEWRREAAFGFFRDKTREDRFASQSHVSYSSVFSLRYRLLPGSNVRACQCQSVRSSWLLRVQC